ncbi:MAG: 6-phosphogluconolactonase [Bdellovibrionaceae bacterium]|nr:6-phosphogluconolactonase [Pseudobdellovibrionaceae bacterium]
MCKTHLEMVERAHLWCMAELTDQTQRSIFVPAGGTPTELYRFWERVRPGYLAGARLLQIDDVLTGARQGLFRNYFETQLPSFREQLVPIDLADATADVAILGFGLNGHVAFHEPGIPADFFSGCVHLSDESRHTLSLESGTWGVTYGLGAFLRTRSALLMVSGEQKRAMYQRFVREQETFPATFLKRHSRLTVLVDFDPGE